MTRTPVGARIDSVIVVCAVLCAVCSPARAEDGPGQTPGGPAAGQTVEASAWGPLAKTYYNVPGWRFFPSSSGTTYGYTCCMPYARYRLAGTDPFLDAALDLPNGAEIIEFQLQACDTSASGEVTAWITRQPNETGLLQELAQTATGLAATPGCTTLTTNVTPPIVVNNQQYYHGVQAEMGLGNAMRLVGMRVGYRLRVSPAPAVATFPNDVPTTHPFFQWIEALAASGITAGCGAGSFCPDMPVTRGQMAVFLAAALGLHFPN